jgi:hypothetical protein
VRWLIAAVKFGVLWTLAMAVFLGFSLGLVVGGAVAGLLWGFCMDLWSRRRSHDGLG